MYLKGATSTWRTTSLADALWALVAWRRNRPKWQAPRHDFVIEDAQSDIQGNSAWPTESTEVPTGQGGKDARGDRCDIDRREGY